MTDGTSTPRPADEPSPWIRRFAGRIPADGTVLDVACGGGRHTRHLRDRGHPVVAVDRDLSGVEDLVADPDLELIEADLEDGGPFPLSGRTFAGVVVTNYLHRPILDDLVAAVESGGVLLYETFARGQGRFGRPTNPDYLLRPGELLESVRGRLRVIAYEDLTDARPARIQRICARRQPDGVAP